MTQAYPLQWPVGRPRTRHPRSAAFKQTFTSAKKGMLRELEAFGATSAIISTNLPVRLDGTPIANRQPPSDKGVAVYFTRNGHQSVFACDQWDTLHDNLHAIAKTIEALSGIERWGSKEMMERAFSGFQQLAAPQARPWRTVLGFPAHASPTANEIEHAYRERAKQCHPDLGGSTEAFTELQQARDKGRQEIGV
jgi:hypothetical protein